MAEYSPGAKDGLIVVDLQVDFCPGGALAVAEGDEVVAPVNGLLDIPGWMKGGDARPGTPPITPRVQAQGGIWPVHCVAETARCRISPANERRKSGDGGIQGHDPRRRVVFGV